MKSGKVWGETSMVQSGDSWEVHHIHAMTGGYSSVHRHVGKWNLFYVITGRLKIRRWKTDYDLIDETILGPGEQCHVPPGEYHQFQALENSHAVEVYFVKIDADDIDRVDCGGMEPAQKPRQFDMPGQTD